MLLLLVVNNEQQVRDPAKSGSPAEIRTASAPARTFALCGSVMLLVMLLLLLPLLLLFIVVYCCSLLPIVVLLLFVCFFLSFFLPLLLLGYRAAFLVVF